MLHIKTCYYAGTLKYYCNLFYILQPINTQIHILDYLATVISGIKITNDLFNLHLCIIIYY